MPQIGYAHRQAPMGRRGMVASCHPLASLAGVDVLRSGGNVVDAAIATNAVLAVTQPNFCGVGGDIFVLYHEAATRRVHFLNGAGRSGARATLDELGRRGLKAVPGTGAGSVSVPGVTRGWRMLLDRFGTRPLASLLEPAAYYAGEGFPLTDVVAQAIREKAPTVDDPEWHRVFAPGGAFPRTGDCFRQPDLARTLAELGREPELFYKGRVARSIAERMSREGFLTAEDLAAHEGEWGEPDLVHLSRLHGVRDAAAHPGPGRAAEPEPARGLRSRALRAPVARASPPADRDDQAGLRRPRPLGGRPRARARAGGGPAQQELRGAAAPGLRSRKAQWHKWGELDGDTTGFVVADAQGNIMSVIQSLYKSFGSGVVAPDTGVVLQNRGAYFNTDPAHPNHFAPGKRPFHTLIACVVTARRAAGAGLLEHGRRRAGDVPRPVAHQRARLRHGDPGGHRAAALRGRPHRSGRRRRTRCASRAACPRHPRGARAQGPPRRARCPTSSCAWATPTASPSTDGTLRGGADPRGDGAAIGF